MRKKLKKITALVAVTAMVTATAAGCGTTDKEKEESVVTKNTEVQTETAVAQEEFSYPMDGQTVTIWSKNPSYYYDNYSDSYYNKNVEEATGLKVEFTHPGDNDEAFNLMIADGDYKDIISYMWTSYPGGGISGAYEDGIAIELNDVIDQYMPNFKAFLEAHPEVDKGIKTDDGKYYAIPACADDSRMGCTSGLYIRQDILDELNLEIPETIDGWHELLVTLKDTLGIAPVTINTSGGLQNSAWLNAFAPSTNSTLYSVNAETGDVEFTGATDGFREFLKVMAQWYAEGLIDPDFATNDSAALKAKILSGDAVISWGYAGSGLQTIALEGMQNNPDFALVAIPGCASEEGADIIYGTADKTYGAGWYGYSIITTACEDVEAAARYLDWMFTEEGIMISNFGIEGETYTMVDGTPTYTDEILNNPEGLSVSQALQKYVRSMSMFPGVQSYDYLMGYYQLDNVKAALSTWGKYGTTEYEVSSLSYTTEENEELSNIATALKTEYDESRIKFILGTLDINDDATWDAYVERLEALELDKAVEINQTAYDRYLAR